MNEKDKFWYVAMVNTYNLIYAYDAAWLPQAMKKISLPKSQNVIYKETHGIT